MQKIIELLQRYFVQTGMNEKVADAITIFILLILVIIIAWLADVITKKIFVTIISKLIRKSKTEWDDLLLKRKVFKRLAHLAPAIVVYYFAEFFAFGLSDRIVSFVQSATYIYMILMGLMVIDSIINSSHDIYEKLPISNNRPIKGYIQLVKILIFFIGGILILSIVLDKSPTRLLTGLGALAAVLLLVFKDTILGLVASIQLFANKMVKPGDWIEMPKHNADGTVEEITLNTVKVQNWDKTISTIPTYALVSESFHNWKGMEESGGRRIKRSINIDMKSVKFADMALIEKFKKIRLLRSYIENKLTEIEEFNLKHGIDDESPANRRKITNLGTFRRYIEEYLKDHPKIHNDMTFLVRQLQPTEKGLPIEIYVFSNDQAWANYEAVQADIFDHILAVIPVFELRVFQNPTGDDFQKLIN